MLVSEIVKLLSAMRNRENDLIYQELLKSEVISHNARLMKQQYDKGGPIENYIVNLQKVELVKEFDGFDNILSTRFSVPNPIRVEPPFISVTNSVSSKRKKNISFLSEKELAYLAYKKFSSNSIAYTWQNKFIKIHNNLDLPSIDISFIPENYLDLSCDCVSKGDMIISEENSSAILSSFNGKDQE